ncbi:hypothetical protein ABEB36_006259 [Hypothenemus hampei]|uniref:sn-1-specific diacylglycerol lipase ABHD11 n=1 Tax=Hypothenemus hampei TaxID=57062 RepID=A0ABD1EPX0_HYPHA
MLINVLTRNINRFGLKNVKEMVSKSYSTGIKLIPVKLAHTAYENSTRTEEKSPLLILHGLFGSKQNWISICKAYAQKLKPSRTVIALDLRNHGESEHSPEHSYAHLAEDVRHFVLQNGWSKVVLMGHSMGGRCAMLFALKYPDLLENLIVVDISPISLSPSLNEMTEILKVMNRVQIPTNVALSKARSLVEEQLANTIREKDVRAFILTNLIPAGEASYKWRVNLPILIEKFHEIAKFEAPSDSQYNGETLFIGGEKSNYIPESDFPKILKLFPKAELKYIAGAGHWVHAEKPNEFLKITMDFLNK